MAVDYLALCVDPVLKILGSGVEKGYCLSYRERMGKH